MKRKILIIGAGKMGGAILKTLINSQEYQVTAADPIFAKEENTRIYGKKIELYTSIREVIKLKKNFDIILLGFKPQFFPSLVANIRKLIKDETLVISIMAGIGVEAIRSAFYKVKIVRTMPNIAAIVKKAVTACYGDNDIGEKEKKIVEDIFSRSGKVYWLNDEEHMHIVTALSGSGPAYYYAFCEIMAQIAADMGLPSELAYQFSIDTMIGASEVLQKQRKLRKLRDSVTSQGGTTQAALDILLQPEGLSRLARITLAAAAERSRELAT